MMLRYTFGDEERALYESRPPSMPALESGIRTPDIMSAGCRTSATTSQMGEHIARLTSPDNHQAET